MLVTGQPGGLTSNPIAYDTNYVLDYWREKCLVSSNWTNPTSQREFVLSSLSVGRRRLNQRRATFAEKYGLVIHKAYKENMHKL